MLRAHAGEDLTLPPVPMTGELMADLERRGLIIRLRPGGHDLAAQPGEPPSASRSTRTPTATARTS